jgi:hypothetical protein
MPYTFESPEASIRRQNWILDSKSMTLRINAEIVILHSYIIAAIVYGWDLTVKAEYPAMCSFDVATIKASAQNSLGNPSHPYVDSGIHWVVLRSGIRVLEMKCIRVAWNGNYRPFFVSVIEL